MVEEHDLIPTYTRSLILQHSLAKWALSSMAIKVVPDIHGVREEFDALKCLRRRLYRPILLGAPGLMDPVSDMNLKKIHELETEGFAFLLKGRCISIPSDGET